NVTINRTVVLRGHGAGETIVQGDGTTGVLSVTAARSAIRGITAIGGTSGCAVDAAQTLLTDVRAWRNVGPGVTASGSAAQIWRVETTENGGDGVFINGADGVTCAASDLLDNIGAGLNLSACANALIDLNRIADNGNGGLALSA